MIKLIDAVAAKYYQNEYLDENERVVFAKLRVIAASIYLSQKWINFKDILDAVISANKENMPVLVENFTKEDLALFSNSGIIRYTPSEYSLTVLPENYFKKEKANA